MEGSVRILALSFPPPSAESVKSRLSLPLLSPWGRELEPADESAAERRREQIWDAAEGPAAQPSVKEAFVEAACRSRAAQATGALQGGRERVSGARGASG